MLGTHKTMQDPVSVAKGFNYLWGDFFRENRFWGYTATQDSSPFNAWSPLLQSVCAAVPQVQSPMEFRDLRILWECSPECSSIGLHGTWKHDVCFPKQRPGKTKHFVMILNIQNYVNVGSKCAAEGLDLEPPEASGTTLPSQCSLEASAAASQAAKAWRRPKRHPTTRGHWWPAPRVPDRENVFESPSSLWKRFEASKEWWRKDWNLPYQRWWYTPADHPSWATHRMKKVFARCSHLGPAELSCHPSVIQPDSDALLAASRSSFPSYQADVDRLGNAFESWNSWDLAVPWSLHPQSHTSISASPPTASRLALHPHQPPSARISAPGKPASKFFLSRIGRPQQKQKREIKHHQTNSKRHSPYKSHKLIQIIYLQTAGLPIQGFQSPSIWVRSQCCRLTRGAAPLHAARARAARGRGEALSAAAESQGSQGGKQRQAPHHAAGFSRLSSNGFWLRKPKEPIGLLHVFLSPFFVSVSRSLMQAKHLLPPYLGCLGVPC